MEEYRIRTACFLILSFSIVLVASAGTSNSYMNKSWADAPLTLDDILKNYYIKIQDKSENGSEISPDLSQGSQAANQTGSDLTGQALSGEENSQAANQTGSDLTGQALSGEEDSEDNNQTSTEATGGQALSGEEDSEDNNQTSTQATDESESNQNINQTIETQQTQTSNQDVNVQTNVDVEMKQRLDLKISEEEDEAPISIEEQNRIESQDKIIVTEHRVITGPDCRTGDVLAGASNADDLRVLLECQEATGTVMHTKNMDDGDYKFFLKLDPQFEFLVNDKNRQETEGFLVVEIVPPDRNIQGVYLPQDGDRVQVWGAWVTDKPKGWHEIHPTWKVVKL
jgi:hypothetical protein